MHKRLKGPIAGLFTPNNAPLYEDRVDEVLTVLREKLDKHFIVYDRVFELGSWLQYFAFDVMGTLTFSKRYGFLDTGKDTGRMLATIKDFMRSSAPLTQIPWLDWALRKNRIGDWLQRTFATQASMGIIGFVAKSINEKKATLAKQKQEDGPSRSETKGLGKDFLTRYVELQENDPDKIPFW